MHSVLAAPRSEASPRQRPRQQSFRERRPRRGRRPCRRALRARRPEKRSFSPATTSAAKLPGATTSERTSTMSACTPCSPPREAKLPPGNNLGSKASASDDLGEDVVNSRDAFVLRRCRGDSFALTVIGRWRSIITQIDRLEPVNRSFQTVF